MFYFKSWAASDLGQRKTNEDSYLIDDKMGLFIVADGMGGHDKGEVASCFTTAELNKIINTVDRKDGDDTFLPGETVYSALSWDDPIQFAVFCVNKWIYDENEKMVAERTAGYEHSEITLEIVKKQRMGTTLVSLLVRGDVGYISHIGDSRCYRIFGKTVQRLTEDHSWVAERVKEGVLSPEEALAHKKRNIITRSVGFKNNVDADIATVILHPPEKFLLCSDGLSNMINERDIAELASHPNLKVACENMVELAKGRGGKDNITALLVEILALEKIRPFAEREFTDL